MFFGFMNMVEYLITHHNYYLYVEQIVFVLLLVLSFCCLNVNSGALIPGRYIAYQIRPKLSFVKGSIIGYLFVHVFIVNISRRDREG
jgi:hypothetical protein